MAPEASYPAHWEADVLLADGRPARLRPLRSSDGSSVVDFWGRLSAQSQYYRFFAAHATLSEEDVARMVRPDHRRQVTLGVFVGADLIGVGDFTRSGSQSAELGLTVEDGYHGYGVGGLLLEHLAQIARETGITQLTAEVLAENRKMAKTMMAAGYAMGATTSGGVHHFHVPVKPTDVSLAVMEGREHRAEANSMRRIFEARTVAFVGGSARRASVGRRLLSNAIAGEFTGRVYVVNPSVESAFGMPSYRSVADIPDDVDLAVIAVPADQVPAVIDDCASRNVHAVVVVSLGYAEAGDEGRQRQAALVEQCRSAGIRLIGPCALGLVNPAGNSLNASMCDVWPQLGPVGFFCQSGPLSLTALRMLVDRGLGLSSFVSAGNRADVSGNDLLQYWEQDEHTQVILCYLESLGNVNKLARLARRVSARKPVVALTSGRPAGATADAGPHAAPPAAIDAMLQQAGVIQVDHIEHLFDVAQLLAHQPLPRGPRLAIVGDSRELTIIAGNVAEQAGFRPQATWMGLAALSAAGYEDRLRAALDDENVDAVLAVFVPAPVETRVDLAEVRAAIARLGAHPTKPLVAVIPGGDADPTLLDAQQSAPPMARRAIPIYRSPERAVLALSKSRDYALWRAQAESVVPVLPDVAPDEAAALVATVLDSAPQGRWCRDDEVAALLGRYGVPILTYHAVDTLAAAVAAADSLGWDVVLKATNTEVGDSWSQRLWRHIRDRQHMGIAWDQLCGALGNPRGAGVVVQAMGSPGLHVRITGTEDEVLGPVVSCRIAGVAAEVLHDVSYRLPPLTRADVSAMLRELQLAPLLYGAADVPRTDVAALEDLISRVAQLKLNQPDVDIVDLDVLAHVSGVSVVGATARVRRGEPRYALYARRLSAPADGM
ncbi:MAG: GNAT family N-acetyltransferase [Austwickia sp.]|nr:GNAT family N-acetyltransferase [Austwickia sp.]